MHHVSAHRGSLVPHWRLSAQWIVAALALFALHLFSAPAALALDAMPVIASQDRVEITQKGLAVGGRGDRLQIDTATGADGISSRMSVNASTPGTDPNWIVFALTNTTDRTIERWITVQRYSMIGSGTVWPDLDSRRLSALTPSVGFLPQRIENDHADIFKITIDPGQTITYAAEMASSRLSRIYMWKPLAYELHVRDRRLFNGIMLGITGLLGIFLTAVFAANHKAIFPSAALVTWCVLIYLCVDFGFWHKLLQISSEETAVYRAAAEAALATSLAIFLHIFLRLGSWYGFVRMLSSVWIVAQLALVFVAVLDPRLAATFARLSMVALGGVGAILILFLAIRGQDRALSLIPTWLLFLVWLFGASMTLTGKLNGDIVVSSLIAGLVLITVLIGFTVTQFAFRSFEPHYGAAPSEQQLRSLAVEGAGAAVWEWHARRGEIKVGAIAEAALGLNVGELSTKVKDFVRCMHPADQERFNVLLWSVQNKNGGEIRTDFRMRHADNSYRWFDLEAASVPTSDRRSLRCVGLLRDVTDQKRSQARLMQDAVVDSLTGMPNRELFLDRLKSAVGRVRGEPALRPTVLFIDLDKFKSVNSSFGLIVGDSLLLTISRRLARHLQPMDTLARIGGDQFAMLILSVTEPEALARLAESVRRALRAPIKIAGQDIVLTGAIGIAVHDPSNTDELGILKDAEIAMYRAKRNGADQIEIFRPDMRDERDNRIAIESDLRQALDRHQIKVVYQPIIYLPTEELAGFEALVRWEHPTHGVLNPQDFIPVAEESDLIVKLGSYVLTEAVERAAEWQKKLPRSKHPLFVSVNVSSRQIFRQDLIQEIRHIIDRSVVPEGVLRLEVTESLVMENPERAAEILDLLQIAGAGLALDDFGTGYSSLAYLERFPFDTIKIDRHLIQSSSDSQGRGPVIVRSIVAMAKELNKKVVAEGVETSDDVGFLRSIGCQYAQGYYYGEAMSERDVLDLLNIVRKSERKLESRGWFAALGRKDKKLAAKLPEPDQKNPAAAGPAEALRPEPSRLDQSRPEATARRETSPAPAAQTEASGSSDARGPQGNQGTQGTQGRPFPAAPPAAAAPPRPVGPAVRPLDTAPPGRPDRSVPQTVPTRPQVPSPPMAASPSDGSLPPTQPRRMPPPHWSQPPRPANDVPSSPPSQQRQPAPAPNTAAQADNRPPPPPASAPQRPPAAPPARAASAAAVTDAHQQQITESRAKADAPRPPETRGPDPVPPSRPPTPPIMENEAPPPPHQQKSESGAQLLASLSRPSGAASNASQAPPEQPEPLQPDAAPPAGPSRGAARDDGDFSSLPPSIAKSLARLAGAPVSPPANDKDGNDDGPPSRKLQAGE